MKRALLVIAVLVAVGAAGIFVALPRLRVWNLEKALAAATDARTAAPIARTLLKANSPSGTRAIVQYARQHEWCDFDPAHVLFLLCDQDSGQIHIVHVGPSGPAVKTGNAPHDEAVTAAAPEATALILSVGEPPQVFKGIHLLSAVEDHADFVLSRPSVDARWRRLHFAFENGRLMASGFHDVSDRELSEWRKNEDWPRSWQ